MNNITDQPEATADAPVDERAENETAGEARDIPLYTTPADPVCHDHDDDFEDPPILRTIRESFWDFCDSGLN